MSLPGFSTWINQATKYRALSNIGIENANSKICWLGVGVLNYKHVCGGLKTFPECCTGMACSISAPVAWQSSRWTSRQNLVQVVNAQRQRNLRGQRKQSTKPCRVYAQAPDIKLITSDVDGTLLNSKQELTPLVERAVQLSRSVGTPVSSHNANL